MRVSHASAAVPRNAAGDHDEIFRVRVDAAGPVVRSGTPETRSAGQVPRLAGLPVIDDDDLRCPGHLAVLHRNLRPAGTREPAAPANPEGLPASSFGFVQLHVCQPDHGFVQEHRVFEVAARHLVLRGDHIWQPFVLVRTRRMEVLGTDRKLSIHSEKHGWTERRDLSV